jgi:hypothetical protein
MPSCTADFSNLSCYHVFMNADLRISVKDYRRNKTLKILLIATPFAPRRFFVTMNGKPWPATGGPVSVTRLFTALRKSFAKSVVWTVHNFSSSDPCEGRALLRGAPPLAWDPLSLFTCAAVRPRFHRRDIPAAQPFRVTSRPRRASFRNAASLPRARRR